MENLTDDEDFVEVVEILLGKRRRPQNYRERPNHFEIWNDVDFIKRFRFTQFIINLVRNEITSPMNRNQAVTAEQKVLLTLRFYATGSFLQVVGDFIGIDKGTASRIVWEVTRTFAGLYNEFIKMPSSEEEMRTISQGFYSTARFPKCIGAVDGTHIKIVSLGGNNSKIYRNRKGFFSYNVQVICDSDCMFQDVVCRWPGSSHDSTIFAQSNIRARFENGSFGDYLRVGDSGYAIKNYLLTPLAVTLTEGEENYNYSQTRTRNCIKRKFGIWKRRFPVLAFGIRLKREKVEGVVIATAVLDNIAKLLKEPDPPEDEEIETAVNFVNDVNVQPYINIFNIRNLNSVVRHQLINNYFTKGLLQLLRD